VVSQLPDSVLEASAARAAVPSPEGAATVKRLALELMPQADAIAAVITSRAVAQEPRLADPDDPSALESASHSTRDNVGAILSMLAYGIPGGAIQPTSGALELFERAAETDDGLTVVLHGYRIGIAEIWQIWAEHVRRSHGDGDTHEVLVASTSFLHAYMDAISEQLIERWAETRRRRRQGLDVSADDLVRKALFSADDGDALRRLDYDPDLTHLGLALPPSLDEGALDQLASRLRLHANARSVSLHHDGGWVLWLGSDGHPDESALEQIEAQLELDEPVGRSDWLPGIEGFRMAHREALDARRVGVLRDAPGLTRHRDVALLAVLCADTSRAQALARAELGPLVADDEVTERLRETLAAYLAAGESHVAAAQQLFVHSKTVTYRIRQAESLLGRKVSERRVELEAALLLHRAFKGDV
jgi:hypothetical protein